MTPTEAELSQKILNTQKKVFILESRLEKVETFLSAICIVNVENEKRKK